MYANNWIAYICLPVVKQLLTIVFLLCSLVVCAPDPQHDVFNSMTIALDYDDQGENMSCVQDENSNPNPITESYRPHCNYQQMPDRCAVLGGHYIWYLYTLRMIIYNLYVIYHYSGGDVICLILTSILCLIALYVVMLRSVSHVSCVNQYSQWKVIWKSLKTSLSSAIF
jgi:hypothetical protein